MATVLVGHVTKDGAIAGPRMLEHLVDVVLQFEGDRHSTLRLVRATKNRFGPADEVGCFELDRRRHRRGCPTRPGCSCPGGPEPVPGTCVTVTVEGRRPLLAEVQALVAALDAGDAAAGGAAGSTPPGWRWCSPCWSGAAGSSSATTTCSRATVGGVRVTEPAADLALALAVASAARDAPIPPATVVLGEVGLSGEVRRVGGRRPAAGRGGPARLHRRAGPARLRARCRPGCASPRSPTSAPRCAPSPAEAGPIRRGR